MKNVLATLAVVTGVCALNACGSTSATGIAHPVAPQVTITLQAPTTTTVIPARVGDTVVCKSTGATIRAKIPPSGQLNKGGGHASPDRSSSYAQLQVAWEQGRQAVVVSCKSS